MPYSPLVSKIRVHNPNRKGSSAANRNAVIYIATREGVSLEQINNVNDLLNVKGMEEKELSENLIHQEADNENYLRYIAKRPRSHGLFGNINTDDLKEVSSNVAKLTQNGRVIYRGVISLSEKDGEALGFRNVNAWNNYLKEVMPEVAQKLGVSSVDHTWVAAFHAEESHPHVHYMLWDNKDRIKSPYIHKATQQKIRIYLEEKMFDNEYERAIRQVNEEELDTLKKSRMDERSYMIKNTEDIMKSLEYAPGIICERLPQRIPNECLEEIAKEVEKLIPMLPTHGSLKMRYMPADAKQQLQVITEKLLERPDMQNSFNRYIQSVEKMHIDYGETGTKIQAEMERAERDIKNRIANRVLSEIKNNLLIDKTAETISSVLDQKSMVEADNQILYEVPDDVIISNQNINAERNSVPFTGQIEEQNSVPSMENQIEEETVLNNYFIEWNDEYKSAIDEIYNDGDLQKAFISLENQAIKGNALAIAEMGKIIERELIDVSADDAKEYYNEALHAFKNVYKSDYGNGYIKCYAAYRIGKLYEFGKGDLEVDYKNAEKWYQRANGNKFAQYSLAKLYLSEKVYVSDKKDINENQKCAVDLLQKSSGLGNPFASYELGNMYHKGICVECDEQVANTYYSNALNKFLNMSKKSTDDSLFYKIGMMYFNGLGVEQDIDEAEKYIKKAADMGNTIAKLKLASLYFERDDLTLKEQAIVIFEELADKDNDMAQYKLGCIYSNGELPDYYNMSKAIKYLEQSAKQGNQFAQCRLGVIYYFGKGVQKDQELGRYWLEQSAEQGNEFAKSVLEGPTVGIDFAYCLVKGALSAMETFNRQQAYEQLATRTQSRQAMKEEYMHRDGNKTHESE